MSRVIALSLLLMLSSCAGIFGGEVPGKTVYVLLDHASSDESPECVQKEMREGRSLLIQETDAVLSLRSLRIPFSLEAGVRGYYQYATWSEDPASRINLLLQEYLECSGGYKLVSRIATNMATDRVLATELQEMVHLAGEGNGRVRIILRAELLDGARREVVKAETFRVERAVTGNDIVGAVRAFNEATQELLQLLVGWV